MLENPTTAAQAQESANVVKRYAPPNQRYCILSLFVVFYFPFEQYYLSLVNTFGPWIPLVLSPENLIGNSRRCSQLLTYPFFYHS